MPHSLATFARSAKALGYVLRLIKTIFEKIRSACLDGGWIQFDLSSAVYHIVMTSNKESKGTTKEREFAQAALENAASYDDWARAALQLDSLDGSPPLPPEES